MYTDEIQKEYDRLTPEEKELLHEMFRSSEKYSETYNRLASTIFKAIPPTPEQFIDPSYGWVTEKYAASLREWVKEDFVNIVNQSTEISIVSMYGSTRQGKSFLAGLLIYYTIVFWHHLRDPNSYYGVGSTDSLAIFILSFNYDKAHEVYLKPLYNFLESNPRFVQVKFQDDVKKKQKEFGIDKIVWSKAALIGHITLASGLQIVSGNDDALSFIGSNVLCAFVSEIAFFIENSGATEDHIFRLYSDLSERIDATVGLSAKLSYTYLDSSANNSESMIEKHILKDLKDRKDVFFRWRRRWDVKELHDKQFPVWKKTGRTFLLCTGDGSYPARILYDKTREEVSDIPADLLIDVPIDVLHRFETNLIKSIKDICGIPTTLESKFISNGQLIENIFDNDLLTNHESIIIADSADSPERLIWNQVYNLFFTRISEKEYAINRAQKEPRWIGADAAHSVKGDVFGLSMGHKEWDQVNKQVMYVTDFAFTIGPGKEGINLEAVSEFIMDMVRLGRVRIAGVFIDTFQSESFVQTLNRKQIEATKQSVDTQLEPYMFLLSLISNGQIKAGKNIFLKNNLKSLYRTKAKGASGKIREKIDHSSGTTNNQYYGEWEKATTGSHAKDCSDAVAQWTYAARSSDYIPTTIYQIENEIASDIRSLSHPDRNKESIDNLKERTFEILRKGY